MIATITARPEIAHRFGGFGVSLCYGLVLIAAVTTF